MLKLLGKENCPICDQSKKVLDENNVEYEFTNLMMPENLSIAKKFNIKVAGKYLYDTEKDSVIAVSDYIDQLTNS